MSGGNSRQRRMKRRHGQPNSPIRETKTTEIPETPDATTKTRETAETTSLPAKNSLARSADFASFVMILGAVRAQIPLARGILEKLDSIRTVMLLSDDPISMCLESWLENPKNHSREVSISELNTELGDVAKRQKVVWQCQNGYALAQRLSHIMANLEQRLDIKVEQDSSNQKRYSFVPKTKALNQPESTSSNDSDLQVPSVEELSGNTGITESLLTEFRKNEYCKELGQNDSAIQTAEAAGPCRYWGQP